MPTNSKPLQVMGILNITPDSFSDGGRYNQLDNAIQRASQLIEQGVDILDIGGESTRPGSDAVGETEELERVIPVIEAIKQRFDIQVSIDTTKAKVMLESAKAGVDLINDVNALREEGAVEAAAETGVPVCLMHMQGQPRTMQEHPYYDDVVRDVKEFFQERISVCTSAGIKRENIWLDPGFGFGKTAQHNYQLLQRLREFHELQLPLLIGLSRKSMLGHVTGRDVSERLAGSLAGATIAAMKGARIIRVHDVKETVDAMKVVAATLEGEYM